MVRGERSRTVHEPRVLLAKESDTVGAHCLAGSAKPVGTGPVPTPKPCLQIHDHSELAGSTGKPARFFPHGNRSSGGFVNHAAYSSHDKSKLFIDIHC
jgi:hypothetical protein